MVQRMRLTCLCAEQKEGQYRYTYLSTSDVPDISRWHPQNGQPRSSPHCSILPMEQTKAKKKKNQTKFDISELIKLLHEPKNGRWAKTFLTYRLEV